VASVAGFVSLTNAETNIKYITNLEIVITFSNTVSDVVASLRYLGSGGKMCDRAIFENEKGNYPAVLDASMRRALTALTDHICTTLGPRSEL
jgi:hypothetical protein